MLWTRQLRCTCNLAFAGAAARVRRDRTGGATGVATALGPGRQNHCVYLAPDEETVREHAKRGGFAANRVSAVRRMIDP
jgi:hypothetical protein